MKYTLNDYRKAIDLLDDEMLILVEKRAALVREIAKIKKSEGKDLHDKQREEAILDRLTKKIKNLTPEKMKELWKKIFEISYSLFS